MYIHTNNARILHTYINVSVLSLRDLDRLSHSLPHTHTLTQTTHTHFTEHAKKEKKPPSAPRALFDRGKSSRASTFAFELYANFIFWALYNFSFTHYVRLYFFRPEKKNLSNRFIRPRLAIMTKLVSCQPKTGERFLLSFAAPSMLLPAAKKARLG